MIKKTGRERVTCVLAKEKRCGSSQMLDFRDYGINGPETKLLSKRFSHLNREKNVSPESHMHLSTINCNTGII